MNLYINKYKVEFLLAVCVIGYILLFSFLAIRRYKTLDSHYYDLGIMNQVVYNTYKGHFLEMTNQDLLANVSRLAIHFDPILALFAPIYFLYAGPEVLIIGQTIIIAVAAIALYLIADDILKNKIGSLLIALLYLLYFPVQRATLFDFHAVTLATSFLLYAIYFIRKKKEYISLLFVILSLLTKEHVGLVTCLFGLYSIIFLKEKRYGIAVCALSLIFFFSTVFFIIPQSRQATHFAVRYFEDIGDSPGKVLIGLIKNPTLILKYLTQKGNLMYLVRIFFPHIIFLVFAPFVTLIAAPEVLINTISVNDNMRSIYFHYNSLIVPFLFYGLIIGISRFEKFIKSKHIKLGVYALYAAFFIWTIYLFDPLPVSFAKEPYWWGQIGENKEQTIQYWQRQLANDSVKVATTPKLAPFFTNRRYYYNFLYDPGFQAMKQSESDIIKAVAKYTAADYVVINKREIGDVTKREPMLVDEFYNHLLNNGEYQKIFDKDEIEVYKK